MIFKRISQIYKNHGQIPAQRRRSPQEGGLTRLKFAENSGNSRRVISAGGVSDDCIARRGLQRRSDTENSSIQALPLAQDCSHDLLSVFLTCSSQDKPLDPASERPDQSRSLDQTTSPSRAVQQSLQFDERKSLLFFWIWGGGNVALTGQRWTKGDSDLDLLNAATQCCAQNGLLVRISWPAAIPAVAGSRCRIELSASFGSVGGDRLLRAGVPA